MICDNIASWCREKFKRTCGDNGHEMRFAIYDEVASQGKNSDTVEIIISMLPFNFKFWVISHTQKFPQILKTFMSQRLGQNVCNLFLSPAML